MTDLFQLSTPVAMLVFNRPDRTRRVFETVRQARPPVLLVVADGPRESRPHEAEICRETRAIFDQVDWPCKVITNFSEKNLGCRNRVSSGLTWVFEQVEEAIILEDDCVPHQSFFRFCEELLIKYRHDDKVGMISGDNFLPQGYTRYPTSYYFTRMTHIWGWATWRRAFQHYDLSMQHWPMLRDSGWLEDILNEDPMQVAHWRSIFNKVWNKEIDTWDYQLTYSYWVQNYTNICASKNLVSNIGFGEDATHTHHASEWAELPVYEMQFPLEHPVARTTDLLVDDFGITNLFNINGFKPSFRSQNLFGYRPKAVDLNKPETGAIHQNLLMLAAAALQQNDPATAVSIVQICERDGGVYRDMHYIRGLCCLLLGDAIGAKKSLELELALFPDNQAARELNENVKV